MYNVFCLQIKGLSVKPHFLRRELSIVFTVYYFLDGILSTYRFKKDCFPFKDGIQELMLRNWNNTLVFFTKCPFDKI